MWHLFSAALLFFSFNAVASDSIEQRFFSQAVDHANPSRGTYQQHLEIFIPDGVVKTAPVIFFIGAEGGPGDIKKLAAPFMREHQAIYIQADHRGYGSYSNDEDQSVPAYVTSLQAIEDFHNNIQTLRKEFTGSWALYGASYGGTLAIEIGAKYPQDADVIISSSGVSHFAFATSMHDALMRTEWPSGLYEKLATRIADLKPSAPFDQNWQDRVFLQYAFIGSVQYKKFSILDKVFSVLNFLSTKEFVSMIHSVDHTIAGSMASNWSASQATLDVTLAEAKSMKFNGHFWAYQQCNEFGGFWISNGDTKIFPQTAEEYSSTCFLKYGVKPSASRDWEVLKNISELQTPVVYVTGKKDPWYEIEFHPADHFAKSLNYILADDGFHCPDREDASVAQKMVDAAWSQFHLHE